MSQIDTTNANDTLSTGAATYRWLARSSARTRKPRHVFLGSSGHSACKYASRQADWDGWQPDAERVSCRLCEQFLARSPTDALTEVPA